MGCNRGRFMGRGKAASNCIVTAVWPFLDDRQYGFEDDPVRVAGRVESLKSIGSTESRTGVRLAPYYVYTPPIKGGTIT